MCTQRDDLRAKFEGTPDKVVQLFTHVAEEVREILASLGFKRLDEVIGRTDLLTQVSRGDAALDDLDLNPVLVQAAVDGGSGYGGGKGRVEVADTLDAQMVKDAETALQSGGKMQLTYNIENTARAIGTRLSSHIVRRFGMDGLREGQITACPAARLAGLGHLPGLRRMHRGCHGVAAVRRDDHCLVPVASYLAGIIPLLHSDFYGATSGLLLANGQAGERLSAVSGLLGYRCPNGCEYMTYKAIIRARQGLIWAG